MKMFFRTIPYALEMQLNFASFQFTEPLRLIKLNICSSTHHSHKAWDKQRSKNNTKESESLHLLCFFGALRPRALWLLLLIKLYNLQQISEMDGSDLVRWLMLWWKHIERQFSSYVRSAFLLIVAVVVVVVFVDDVGEEKLWCGP